MMTTEPQRVVMIQDASRDVNSKAIRKALTKFSLKAGDQLIIVAIFYWLNSPMGYMVRVDSSSFVSTNGKKIDEELPKIKEDYHLKLYMTKLHEYFQEKQIELRTVLLPGPAPEAASNAARKLQATHLIINKQMQKDMRRFMNKLRCGIYRITCSNSIEELKGPKLPPSTNSLAERPDNLRYTEMIPGSGEDELPLLSSRSSSSNLFWSAGDSIQRSTEASTSSLGGSHYGPQNYQEGKFIPNIEEEIAGNQSLFCISGNKKTSQIEVNQEGKPVDQEQHSTINEASHMEDEFTNSICSVCNNRRPEPGWKRDFSYADLWAATQGFSAKNFLSEGGFGAVYKGQLNGVMVAVKQHKYASLQGEKEFKSEVNVLSKARNENVVMLLGSCSEGNNRLLVYEYVCNGSLDQHLSEHSRSPLSWGDRINVAMGVAKGLLYLHQRNIIHRDMRPNNILLTHDHQPLLGDFGLARTQNQDSIHSTEVIGTLGYLAPEYAEYGKVSTKTDVYSFGVVLLQLITGMRTTDKRLGGRSLVGWARPLLREKNYPDLIDERIINSHDFHQLFWMVRIAEKCLSRDPNKRLNMVAVVNVLNNIVEGSTCGTIGRGYSPARSDSFYSESDSEDFEDEMQEYLESEGELENQSTESTASNSITQMSQMIVTKLPPSPPIPSISLSSSSSYKFYDESNIDFEAQSNCK